MNHISGFFHHVFEVGRSLGDATATIPQALTSLSGRVNTVVQNLFGHSDKVFQGAKHLWSLGPVQTAKNATQTLWAATQIVRQPEFVLKQLPNCANVIRYGLITCSFYRDVSGQSIPFDPFDLLAKENLNLLANGTELTVMCSSSQKVTKKEILDFLTKLTQVICLGIRPAVDQDMINPTTLKNLEFTAGALGAASVALTIYAYSNEINKISIVLRDAPDLLDQDMADADMTLDEMDEAGLFRPSEQKDELEELGDQPRARSASPTKVEEKEELALKKAIKAKTPPYISNPPHKLSVKEEREIDRAVRQLENFWFFDSMPPPPKK